MYFLPIEIRRSFTPDLDKTQVGGAMLLAVAIAVPPVMSPPTFLSQQQIAESIPTIFPERVQDATPQAKSIFQTQEFSGGIPVAYVETPDLPPGMSKVIQAGSNGLYREVYQVNSASGENQQLAYTYPIKYPEKRVVLRNSQPVSGERFNLDKLTITRDFIAEATAYTHTGYRTASGVYPRYGLIATDPRVIPLGTKLYVEGYGYAIAADTGGAIKGDKIDVFLDTESRALRWGRRKVRVFVLGEQ